MRILFADTFPDRQRAQLEAAGHVCEFRPDLDADGLVDGIPGHEVLVVRSTRVTAAAIAAADVLRLIVRAGAGTNTIDVAAAADRAIYVCNVPGRNAVAVAELAFGLLASIDRNIPDNVADLRRGRWDKRRYQRAEGLLGRRVGVVGVGAIGLAFAERCSAFGMEVHVLAKADRNPETAARLAAVGAVDEPTLEDLVAACDVVSLHVPLVPETAGMVDGALLRHLRPGGIVINTSRGGIVDAAALIAAMDEKGIRAGLDVFPDEPATGEGSFDSPLASHPSVYGTHHIGASTEQAQNAIADEVVRIVAGFAVGEVRHAVNEETALLGSTTLEVRHRNEVGVLAAVLGLLGEAGLNVEQMENRIFAGDRAASAVIRITGDVSPVVLTAVASHDAVFGVALTTNEERA